MPIPSRDFPHDRTFHRFTLNSKGFQLSALNDLLNTPKELKYKGVTYFLKQPDQDQQAQYGAWLEQRARDSVGRAVDVSPERQERLDAGVTASIAAGEYEWGGEICNRALRTPSGFAKLVEILLADQAVTYPMAVEMVNEQLKELAAALLQKATSDPKAFVAAREMLGLPSGNLSSPFVTRRSGGRKASKR